MIEAREREIIDIKEKKNVCSSKREVLVLQRLRNIGLVFSESSCRRWVRLHSYVLDWVVEPRVESTKPPH